MNPSVEKILYTCPYCNSRTRLPDPLPTTGLYKVSCAICKNKSLIEFKNSSFEILEPKQSKNHNQPSQNPKKPPLWEKKIQKVPTYKNHENNIFQIFPTYFQILKNRLQNPQRKNLKIPTKRPLTALKPLRFFFLLTSMVLLLTAMFLGAEIFKIKNDLQEYLTNLSKGKPTKVLDRNGQVLSEIFQKRISTLPLREYPAHLIQTLLYIEDTHFYSHNGIDIKALIRATITNTMHLRYKQGASTITQQLARILLNDRRKSISRKWKELIVALALETYLTKDQILEYYMNHVYLGHGAYGFGEAIKFYLGKNPSELTKLESLLLASLASSPNRYSPLKNPEFSKQRLEAILVGFKNRNVPKEFSNFTEKEINDLYSQFSTRSPNETVFGNRQDDAPYVTEHIRQILQTLTKDLYEEGGYTIETTIHKDIQKHLSKIVYEYTQKVQKNGLVKKVRLVSSNQNNSNETIALQNKWNDVSLLLEIFSGIGIDLPLPMEINSLQAAIIGMNPYTGEILFMHGGDRFGSDNQFNRATKMRRQTGSSIKPILFSAAIDSKVLTTADKILDAPLIYRGSGGLPNWTPDNIIKNYDGEINLRYALLKSKNTAAVQVAEKLGIHGMEKYFSAYFFPDKIRKATRFRSDLSLALGSLELSPLEMAQAYSAFLNKGKIHRPFLIKKIVSPEGMVIYQSSDEFDLGYPEERTVIRPDTAEIMLSLLKDSARSISHGTYKGPLAGKTGTTNDHRDTWFIGLIPGLSMAVWLGYDNSAYGMGSQALGGTLAAPLWLEVLKVIEKEKAIPLEKFPEPSFAIARKLCEPPKVKCSDCPPNTEWFLQDMEITCNHEDSFSQPQKREVFQDLF